MKLENFGFEFNEKYLVLIGDCQRVFRALDNKKPSNRLCERFAHAGELWYQFSSGRLVSVSVWN